MRGALSYKEPFPYRHPVGQQNSGFSGGLFLCTGSFLLMLNGLVIGDRFKGAFLDPGHSFFPGHRLLKLTGLGYMGLCFTVIKVAAEIGRAHV